MPLDDGIAHAQDGVKALLDVLDEPARLLQALLQRLRAAFALVRLQRAGVDVVHAQPRHHIAIELGAKVAPGLHDNHIGHDDVAFDVDESASGLGLQAPDQPDRLLDQRLAGAAQLCQSLHVTLGQQLDGLRAHAQRHIAHRLFGQVAQLKTQALRQIARPDAHRFQMVQQLERHGKALNQLLGIVGIAAGQAVGQRFQAVFQIAIIIERLDEKLERRAVLAGQPQHQHLAVQMRLQRLLAARKFGGVGLVVIVVVVLARGRLRAPFGIIGRNFDAAIAFPRIGQRVVQRVGGARLRRVGLDRGLIGLVVIAAGAHVGVTESELLGRRGLVGDFQKRVVIQHLLDFLAQLQRGELQQADRLLELGRQSQMLRDSQRQTLLHHMRKCSPRYTRRTSALLTISDGVPRASTLPSLMMKAWSHMPSVSRTL